MVHNNTLYDLEVTYTLSSHKNTTLIPSKSHLAFHCNNPVLFVRKKNLFQWSFEIALTSHDGSILMPFYFEKYPNLLLSIDFYKQESTIRHVLIREETVWPYKIANLTDQLIIINQKNSESLHQVNPGNMFEYALDEPYGSHVIFISFANCMKELTIDKYGPLEPFRIQNELCWFGVDIKTSGSVFLISVFPTVIPHRKSFVDDSNYLKSTTSFQLENDDNHPPDADIKMIIFSLCEVGFALYNNDLEEFLYCRLSDINLSVVIENSTIDSLFNIRWIQIDNQLFQSKYPVCLCPKTLTKADSYSHPFITASFKQILNSEYENFRFFENIFLKIKDIYFNIDENTFYEIVMFWRSFAAAKEAANTLRRDSLANTYISSNNDSIDNLSVLTDCSISNITDQNYLIRSDRFDVDLDDGSGTLLTNVYIANIEINQCGVYFSFPTASDVDENKFLKSISYYSPIYKILASTQ